MDDQIELVEATVDEIHSAMENGDITSRTLVERYLDRIEAYDRSGPELNSLVTVNDAAVERASELDDALETEGFVGPLHGIPILLKDQAETAGLRSTFGSAACADYVPEEDATITAKLKNAGAVIIGKTNLPDFACSWFGYSSAGGQTKNPYDLNRDPGGSSAGTGTAVAANLGTIGIGEDTGGSIRVPSANCNLFGIRVTTGLVSRTGLSPIVPRQDTAGPMARTVADMAHLLDAIVGYDPEDTWTGANAQTDVDSYTEYLNEDGLEGARIGVLRDVFGDEDDPRSAPVNASVETALTAMSDAGAELVDPVSVPDLDAQVEDTTIYDFHGKLALNEFLAARDGIPYDSLTEIHDAGEYHEMLDLIEDIVEMTDEPEQTVDFWRKTLGQDAFRRDVIETFAADNLDALAFPDVQVVPPTMADLEERYTADNFPTNTVIGAQTQCPAVSVPGELTDEGLPVGVELLGKPYDEPALIEMAYAYECAADTRVPPETAPPLSES